jgi:hypothetical protein
MKSISLTFITLIAINICAYAQNTFPPNGNVGIGTNNPASTLEVQNAMSGWLMNLRTTAYNPGDINGLKFYSGYIGENKWSGISSVAEDVNSNHTGLALYSNQIERLRITSGGNIGIGTNNPASTLEVQNGMNGWLMNLRTNAYNPGDINGLKFYSGYIGEDKWSGISSVVEDVNSNHTGLALYANALEELRVTSSGNVLIGKTSQINTSYKLDVNGNVRANQLVVNTNGADFVFAPSYRLHSLSTLKKYIDQNHHLPEIPSARQMRADGLNVGDNQVKLLQKVEELTLYTIASDKNIREEKTII